MAHSQLFEAVVLAVFVTGAFLDRSIANERVALVIGNAGYEHTEPLQSPRNDAIDMSRTLRDLGFEVIEGLDLERAAFEGKLQEFLQAAEGAEATLLYYAGHGLQVDGKNYLVPVNAALASEEELHLDVISLETAMTALRSPTNIVILDACRANPLARMFANSMEPNRSNAVGQGLGRIEGAANTLIALAAEPDSVVEAEDRKNSPFTEALLAHFAVPGVSVHDLMMSVSDAVATQTNGRQRPWTQSSLRQPFFFNLGGETEAANRTSVAAAAGEPKVSPDSQAADGKGDGAQGATEHESPTAHPNLLADGVSGNSLAGSALQDIPKNVGAGLERESETADALLAAPIAAPENTSGNMASESLASELKEEVFEVDFGRDGSELAHNGTCDDLRFYGEGMGEELTLRMIGRDAADCRNLLDKGRVSLHALWGGPRDPVEFGDDGSERAHDLECDDLRFVGNGTGKSLLAEDIGRDAADCRRLLEQGRIGLHPLFGNSRGRLEFGDNGSRAAYDGECDDPRFDGNGMAKTLLAGNMGHDALDCRILLEQGRIRPHPLFQEPGDTLDFGNDGSEWANDGECDDPRFVGDGMAETLLSKDVGRDAADCHSLFEEKWIRLHPLFRGPGKLLKYGDDGSEWIRDGACDDPRFVGDGVAETLLAGDMGRDAADCRALFELGRIRLNPLFGGQRDSLESPRPGGPGEPVDFGDDGSEWANDGECDDPRFVGDGMAETLLARDMGRDAADCRSLFEEERIRLNPLFGGQGDSLESPRPGGPGAPVDFGDDGSEWANDGECDDPRFVGDGMAETLLAEDMGRDAADCRSLFEEERIRLNPLFGGQGDSLESPRPGGTGEPVDFGDDGSEWANDGECDDPRFVGDGMAETLLAEDMGRDAADCRDLFELGRIRLNPVGG